MSPWKLIGLVGALMFGGRWLVQFIASKRHGKAGDPAPVLVHEHPRQPDDAGYFIFGKNDAVGILQNLFPSFTACYSLYLDIRHCGWHRDAGRLAPARSFVNKTACSSLLLLFAFASHAAQARRRVPTTMPSAHLPGWNAGVRSRHAELRRWTATTARSAQPARWPTSV